MNDYMKALHQRFFREPAYPEIRREALLKLADLAIELREEISLASFTAGFQLALGIAGELTPYCFEDDEEERALRRLEREAQ